MLDDSVVGWRGRPFEVEVEKGRLRLFAKAIGETDPVYHDEAAARAAGHRALPVPPTFLFCLEMERDDPYDWFTELGIPLGRVLHGGQAFTYHAPAYAGDTLRFESEVTAVWHKKGGALEFLVHRNVVTNQHGAAVAEFDRTVVIRHPT
ncbi:MaoC family dehydratase N-terminal domain-containing protein [bacterium]|nr:MaoC family dehydratase N-terminal domain-containing protein [bacterium]